MFCLKRWSMVGLVALVAGTPAVLAEGEDAGWKDTAEFSFVATDGNSESTSLGLKNVLGREWERSSVVFRTGAVRVETTAFSREAVGGQVQETKATATTTEKYYANGQYDRKITDRFLWFAGGGWDRNRPSGIENRYIAEAGVGNVWADTDDVKFKTNYGATFTDEEFTSGEDDNYGGLRFAWDYSNNLTGNTTYTNVLVLDENLDETSDWRADMDNGLAVSMNDRLALKVGLQLLYDNRPVVLQIENDAPPPTTLPFELEELDTIFTISLVVNVK